MGVEISKVVFGKTKEWKKVEKEVNSSLEEQRKHYRPKSLQELADSTGFSKREIQIFYRSFKENCPSGIVSIERFQEIYSDFFYMGNANEYARLVFSTFDGDGNGEISFQEFVEGLSSLWRGTLEEKLKWIFNLYDYDVKGYITERNLYHVIGSIYDMMGQSTRPPINEDDIVKHAHFVFRDENMCKNLELFRVLLESQFRFIKENEKFYKARKDSEISQKSTQTAEKTTEDGYDYEGECETTAWKNRVWAYEDAYEDKKKYLIEGEISIEEEAEMKSRKESDEAMKVDKEEQGYSDY